MQKYMKKNDILGNVIGFLGVAGIFFLIGAASGYGDRVRSGIEAVWIIAVFAIAVWGIVWLVRLISNLPEENIKSSHQNEFEGVEDVLHPSKNSLSLTKKIFRFILRIFQILGWISAFGILSLLGNWGRTYGNDFVSILWLTMIGLLVWSYRLATEGVLLKSKVVGLLALGIIFISIGFLINEGGIFFLLSGFALLASATHSIWRAIGIKK